VRDLRVGVGGTFHVLALFTTRYFAVSTPKLAIRNDQSDTPLGVTTHSRAYVQHHQMMTPSMVRVTNLTPPGVRTNLTRGVKCGSQNNYDNHCISKKHFAAKSREKGKATLAALKAARAAASS
jgi:hypothetical protein